MEAQSVVKLNISDSRLAYVLVKSRINRIIGMQLRQIVRPANMMCFIGFDLGFWYLYWKIKWNADLFE